MRRLPPGQRAAWAVAPRRHRSPRHLLFIIFTFIEPQGASHGKLNQPSPQFQADGPQSVKVDGRIEGLATS